MTLDETIKHCEDVASDYSDAKKIHTMNHRFEKSYKCEISAEEHRQLAEWLRELKELREQTRWIPVSERLPEDRQVILFCAKTGCVTEGIYFDDDTKMRWYSWHTDTFARDNVVTAWMSLPEPYQGKEDET